MTIRGKTIALASHKKREREKREKELGKNLENLYVTFNENPTGDTILENDFMYTIFH
jgi:hypothetical protein